ncbi:MAG: hypothetical protein DID92_2727744801 [Candidatus Nitrotoga sp. SPKER]|nr:MAG: hypothetical protein DID92_2727744801 [Candidatus Nitrotoga sp. SPKER]
MADVGAQANSAAVLCYGTAGISSVRAAYVRFDSIVIIAMGSSCSKMIGL